MRPTGQGARRTRGRVSAGPDGIASADNLGQGQHARCGPRIHTRCQSRVAPHDRAGARRARRRRAAAQPTQATPQDPQQNRMGRPGKRIRGLAGLAGIAWAWHVHNGPMWEEREAAAGFRGRLHEPRIAAGTADRDGEGSRREHQDRQSVPKDPAPHHASDLDDDEGGRTLRAAPDRCPLIPAGPLAVQDRANRPIHHRRVGMWIAVAVGGGLLIEALRQGARNHAHGATGRESPREAREGL